MKPRHSFVFNFRRSLPRVIQFGTVIGIITAGSTAQAVDYFKANNENNLNTTAAWLDSAGNPATSVSTNVTNSTDLWTWDNRVTNANSGGDGVNNVRASDQGVRTVRILDPEVAVAISLDTATAGRTMTYTAGGGIDMANATQDLTFVNGFYRATGGVAASYNVKTGRKLEFLSAASQNVRGTNVGGGTVSMNTDGVSAGRIVIGGVFNPSNVIIGAGLVEFNSPSGTTRNGTSSTVVNGGTLVVNNASGSATGSGTVTINSTGTVTGQGRMTGLVTINNGGSIAPGNGIGSLTAGSLNLAAGSTFKWEGVDPLNADIINVTNSGGFSPNGCSLQLFNVGTTDPFTGLGTYNIFSYSGSIGGSGLGGLSVAPSSRIDGQLYQFGSDGINVTLTISLDTRPKASWNADAGGNWSDITKWTGGVSPNLATFIANLGGSQGVPITAPRTVNLDVASTVGTLNFDSAQSFTLAGPETLSFDEGLAVATLQVKNGSHEISAPIALSGVGLVNPIDGASSVLTISGGISGAGGIAKSGPGTLILSGDNNYSGDTSNGSGGILQIGNGGTVGSVGGAISNSGVLRFNRSDTFGIVSMISGTGSVEFAGSGTASLQAENTYSGGTSITSGSVEILSPLALQNSTLTHSLTGGTLTLSEFTTSVTLGGLTGDRPFPLTNVLDVPVDLTVGQNNSSNTYTASTAGIGGAFTKAGTGTFTLSGTHVFTGNATINGGVLALETGSNFTCSALNTTVGGSKLLVNGGTFTSSVSSLLTNASAGLQVAAGTANFDGGIASENNPDNNAFFVNVTGGILNAASISIPRGNLNLGTAEPAAGSATAGLYINGGAVNISGTLGIGKNATNSSANARMDSGSLTVNGTTTVTINSPDRWSVLDIAGGTFTSTDITGGVVLGGTTAGQVVMNVRNLSGLIPTVAMAERFQFGQPDLAGSSILELTAGNLYVGGGGMVLGSANPSLTARLKLAGGVLGATADSSSNVRVSLTGPAVVTGADALDVPHTVSFSGTVDGTGSLTKNGSGSVSFTSPANSFSGTVTVNSGTLGLSGQSGAVTVAATGALTPIGTLNAQAASTIEGKVTVAPVPGRIHSQGVLTLGAGSVLDVSGIGTLTQPYYTIASGTAGVSGTFGSIVGSLPDGYTLSHTHNNGSGFPVVALIGTPTAYDIWASSFGLEGDEADINADPDGDGVKNLIEYAMGRNPATGGSGAPALGRSGDFLTLTFDHIAGGNLTFFVEANDGLDDTWETVHTFPPFGAAGTEVYTDNVAVGSSTRRFIRLSVAITE